MAQKLSDIMEYFGYKPKNYQISRSFLGTREILNHNKLQSVFSIFIDKIAIIWYNIRKTSQFYE